MAIKIVLIGAGSASFTRGLVAAIFATTSCSDRALSGRSRCADPSII